jgi:hypothetical protein
MFARATERYEAFHSNRRHRSRPFELVEAEDRIRAPPRRERLDEHLAIARVAGAGRSVFPFMSRSIYRNGDNIQVITDVLGDRYPLQAVMGLDGRSCQPHRRGIRRSTSSVDLRRPRAVRSRAGRFLAEDAGFPAARIRTSRTSETRGSSLRSSSVVHDGCIGAKVACPVAASSTGIYSLPSMPTPVRISNALSVRGTSSTSLVRRGLLPKGVSYALAPGAGSRCHWRSAPDQLSDHARRLKQVLTFECDGFEFRNVITRCFDSVLSKTTRNLFDSRRVYVTNRHRESCDNDLV